MSKFHIEGDWYIVPDQYSWNLARRAKKPTDKSEWAEMTYHSSVEAALRHYLRLKQAETAGKAQDGTLKDLIDNLTAERNRLSEALRNAFSQAIDFALMPSPKPDPEEEEE